MIYVNEQPLLTCMHINLCCPCGNEHIGLVLFEGDCVVIVIFYWLRPIVMVALMKLQLQLLFN